MFLRLLLIACLALLIGIAVADDFSVARDEIILSPNGEILNSLDDPEEDTLYYDDDSDQYFVFTTLANYYTYVRFTPPSEFTLRSVYIAIDVATAGICSVWVHLPGASNRPGQQLIATTFDVSQSTWYDVTLPDSHTFAANQDFMIVVGRAPGPTGWRPFLDGAATQNRTRITTGARLSGNYQTVTVDARFRAGGHYAPFTDVAVIQCFNEVQGRPSFNFLPNTPMLLKAAVFNPSNQTVDNFTVTWQVRDAFGDLVFTNEAAGTDADPQETLVITATQTYTPTDAGVFMVTAILDADNDANANNDTTFLRFFTEPLPRYLRYDDNGDAEGSVTFTDTRLGVAFRPPSYPAQVESLRVYFSGSGTATVHLYHNNAAGRPNNTPAWQDNVDVVEGWNVIPINPPLQFVANRYITAAVVHGTSNNVPLGRDGNPPNAASITRMDTVGWQYSGGSWSGDVINGNWCIQPYVNTALRPPTIETSTDTLQFDTVAVGQSRTLTFYIRNTGETGELRVTRFRFAPAAIGTAYDFNPDSMTIGTGDSVQVSVTFTPPATNPYNGRVLIDNNSPGQPVDTMRILGVGGPNLAASVNFNGLPATFALGQNYPNPFNPSTEIEFALPTMASIRLTVFNLLGQEIAVLASGNWEAGYHRVNWDATGVPAGIYFYRLEAGDYTSIRKMMLLK